MKRKIIIAGTFLLFAWAFTSCESLSDCKTCAIVKRNSGGTQISSIGEAEYCGAELIAAQAANPTVTNPVTGDVTKFECH